MGKSIEFIVPPVTTDGSTYTAFQGSPLAGEALISAQPELPDIPYIPVSDIVRELTKKGLVSLVLTDAETGVFTALDTMPKMDNFRHLVHYFAVVAIKGGATEEAAGEAGGKMFELLAEALKTQSK